ncbi:hypothetical protein M514_26618 [Trichuris suis]|uniref:Uncharacterized protein n=1 Tax=Trichuris suis TaxID=68888 RepID=A0A085MVD9_9BILA|nr:hypothetical protein M514_26618 [Trichuris suis]
MNVSAAHRHYDVREPPPGVKGPIGIRTPFSWTIIGHVPDADCCLDFVSTYFVGTGHVCSCPSAETVLKQQLERFWCIESQGMESIVKRQTEEQVMVNELLQATTMFGGERYEVGLSWKSPQLRLSQDPSV